MRRVRHVSAIFQLLCVIAFLLLLFFAANLAIFGIQGMSPSIPAPPQPLSPTRVTTYSLGSQSFAMKVLGNPADTFISGWLSLAFLAVGIALLYRLFGLYRRGVIFGRETVRSYRWIAIWLLAGWLLSNAMQFLNLLGSPTTVQMHFSLDEMFFGGVLLLLISWIMEEGRKLQEEQALVV